MERLSKKPRARFVHDLKQELMDMTAAHACGEVDEDVSLVNVDCVRCRPWSLHEACNDLLNVIHTIDFTVYDYELINLRAHHAKREQLNDAEEYVELKRSGRLEPEEPGPIQFGSEKDFNTPL